jgi:hypothetical protein
VTAPKIEWQTDIDITWFMENGVMIEEHSADCHCGDCKQVSPGTNPGNGENQPL